MPSAKATEGAELGSEGFIGRQKVGSRVSDSERPALAACIETNRVRNSSGVLSLPEWQCSSVPRFVTVASAQCRTFG